jgi:hypothetical protein
MRRTVIGALFALFLATGCGHVAVRPTAMAQAENLRQTPAAQDAARLAPQAYASAQKLQRDAERAYDAGDPTGAEILSEHAIAAYEHALALARLSRASDSARRAGASLSAANRSLAEIEEELSRATASFNDIETRLKTIHDAMPLASVGRADWGRDQARLSASRSLGLDARLLCAAARMLKSEVAGLGEAQAAVEDLERRLAVRPNPAPIDPAMRARAACLGVLVRARREAGATSSTGKADELLSDLSSEGARLGGIETMRDERGVIVTLRGLSGAAGLGQPLAEPLRTLARIAASRPDFPVQIVVHGQSSRPEEMARERTLGQVVSKSLANAGAPPERLEVQAAGAAHPVAASGAATDRNSRVEIVFVDPGG